MYPIAWFPMVDPNETYSIDYIKTNKGIETIYREDVSFNGTEPVRQFFGWCPKFVNDTIFTFDIKPSLGMRFQNGFGITATVFMKEFCTNDGRILKFYNTSGYIEIGINHGSYYVKHNSETKIEIGDVISTNVAYNFGIVFGNLELRIYLNKRCVYTKSCYYPSNNLVNTLIIGGAYPFTIMNVKVYDTELSMRQMLEDYAFLYGHYKFDGSSSDDASYNVEYDCSGIGIDASSTTNFSLSSTYSPIRPYSAVINGAGVLSIPTGPQFYVCAWINVLSMTTDIFKAKLSNQSEFCIKRYGPNIQFDLSDSCMCDDTPPTIPYPNSEWIFVELSLYWSALAARSFKARLSRVGDEPIEFECMYINTSTDDMTIDVGRGMAISDLRTYVNPLTDAEVSYLINRNVHIDDKGTLYATELQDLGHLSTFSFGDRGQIMAPDFTDTKDIGENKVMEYDYLNGIMNLNVFKEV